MNNLQFKDVIDYIVNKTPWKDDTSEEIIIKQENIYTKQKLTPPM